MLDIVKETWIETELNSFTESEQAIKAKTGIFLNPATGAVWDVWIKEGKLLIDVPNFSFELSPSSHTRFKPVHAQIDLEFEFDLGQNQPLLLHIYAKGINRATFIAIP